jgi:Reverse transcriptase (RNA-dependent DNA polymerase)
VGYLVKHTSEGNVDRFKTRLMVKSYTQTYSMDYEETFALLVKINTIRTLILCAVNFEWDLCQLEVKNFFLHGT